MRRRPTALQHKVQGAVERGCWACSVTGRAVTQRDIQVVHPCPVAVAAAADTLHLHIKAGQNHLKGLGAGTCSRHKVVLDKGGRVLRWRVSRVVCKLELGATA